MGWDGVQEVELVDYRNEIMIECVICHVVM